METLQLLENRRNQTETRLIMFPKWFVKSEWEVYEYMQGGCMRKATDVNIEFLY